MPAGCQRSQLVSSNATPSHPATTFAKYHHHNPDTRRRRHKGLYDTPNTDQGHSYEPEEGCFSAIAFSIAVDQFGVVGFDLWLEATDYFAFAVQEELGEVPFDIVMTVGTGDQPRIQRRDLGAFDMDLGNKGNETW